MRYFYLYFFPLSLVFADLNRFVDSFDFDPVQSEVKVLTKSSAYISSNPYYRSSNPNFNKNLVLNLDRETLEKSLGESISHRYQASGKVVAFLTRAWTPLKVSSNFIIKISDSSPDQLSPSVFTRFSIWDNGKLIGSFAEPLRLGHYVDVLFF